MRLFRNKLVIMYLTALMIIGLGFIVGDGYKIYDDNQRDEYINPYWVDSEYRLLANGVIDKYEGWYGISWKNTYICYISLDVSNENFELYCELLGDEYPEEYVNWSEKEYVDYLMNMSVKDEYNRVYAKIDSKVAMIEMGSANIVENYEKAVPKIIVICAVILLLPILQSTIKSILK